MEKFSLRFFIGFFGNYLAKYNQLMKIGRIHKAVRLMILIMLWAAVLFLVAELALQINSGYKVSGIAYDEALGWRFKKNHRSKKIFPDKGYWFSTNSKGFRDSEHRFIKPKDTKRIIFLGDSYTAGMSFANWHIFTSLFESMIEDREKNEYEYDVMNAAISAWATDQQFLYLQGEGIYYQPDYVFLMVAPNDIREAYAKSFFRLDDNGSLRRDREAFIPLKDRLYWFLSNNFCSYQFLQNNVFKTNYGNFNKVFQHFPVSIDLGDYPSPDHPLFLKEVPHEIDKARKLFAAIVGEMNGLCASRKCQLVLVMLPTKMEFDEQLRPSQYQSGKIAEYVKGVAIEQGIAFLDLYSEAAREERPLKMFIDEEYHFSRYGHRFVADKLYEFFKGLSS